MPGEWHCMSCNYPNFGRQDTCRQCGDRRHTAKPGDWYCSSENCGCLNFANRSTCFKCGEYKDAFSVPSGWKTGDWMCTRVGCNEHNYASRLACHRCNTPRHSGSGF